MVAVDAVTHAKRPLGEAERAALGAARFGGLRDWER